MSASRIGIELLADRVRAVALGRIGDAPRATMELPWDPARPADAARALGERLGGAQRVALSVGLAQLHVARVTLPPLGAADRRRALALDATRHFALDAAATVALAGDAAPNGEGEPAFAVERARLATWIDAFSALGPIECVEAAPTSVARALGQASDGAYALPAGDDEIGMLQLHDGRVTSVRRAPRVALDETIAPRPLPARDGVGGEWLAAWGAALGVDQPADVQLLDDATAHAIGARRVGRVTMAAVACGLALGAALVSADRFRARQLAQVDAEIATTALRAAPVESIVARLGALQSAARAGSDVMARRTSVLAVLAALGERLPADAVVDGLRVEGDAWRIDGVARDAAAIVPALDADPRFADVRAAAPSSRLASGAARETFSIAFRARGGEGAR